MATPAAPAGRGWPFWLLGALFVALAAIAAGLIAWRRRGAARVPETFEDTAVAAAVPDAPPARATPPPQFLDPAPAAIERAWIDLDEPTIARAGINLVTMTADVTVIVRNGSPAYATGVTLEISLTSAQPGQDEALAAMFAAPIVRPATPPFDLAPGESRRVRALATLPREAIMVLTAGDRPMCVPVVALRTDYGAGGGVDGQTTAAYAIGIERPGQAKLAPFWLDQPSRMYDAIGIRAHATVVKR